MTRRVLKWSLPGTGDTVLSVPDSVEFLQVHAQAPFLSIWGLCETDDKAPALTVVIRVVGTGWEFEHDEKEIFLGTAITPDGNVWHVFGREAE